MNSRRLIVAVLAPAAALVALLAAGGCGAADGAAGNKKPGLDEPPPVPVTVEAVGHADVRRTLVLSGSIRPESEVRLVSKVAGRVESLAADTCDEVSAAKSPPLAVIDHGLQAAALKQAEAARAVASVSLADLERDVKRAEDLSKQGVINQQSLDKAVAARDLAASQLAQADAAVAMARVSLEETNIRATIDGTVTHRFIDKGDFVSPGQPLFAVQNLRTVKVLASVAQADLPRLTPGKSRARVMVEGVEKPFDALVTKVEPALDPATLSAPIELRVENMRREGAGGARADAGPWVLASGMSARVELDIERRAGAPVLPQEAVRNDGQRDFVFVPDMTAFEVDYAVALPEGLQPLALKGLPETDFEGMKVKAVKVSEPMSVFRRKSEGEGASGDSAEGTGKVMKEEKPRRGQLVSFRFEFPKGSAAVANPWKPGAVVAFVPVGPGNSKLELLPEGLGSEASGAAPHRPVRFGVKRVDVKLGALGASPSEMVRLVELLEPIDLVGKRVVMRGVSRVTDGARVQLIGDKPVAGSDGKAPSREDGGKGPAR